MSKESVSAHYDASSENYHIQYEREKLNDISLSYPANYFRLQMLINSFLEKGVKKIVEVGVGEGTPLITLARTGIGVSGFDVSQEMVKKSKANLQKNGLDSSQIIWGDIQDPVTYSSLLKNGQFDALLAMGVMPHVRNDVESLMNMKSMIRSGGSVFIEFRNKLFSLFTFNRYTYEFIMDDLLADVSPQLKKIVSKDLEKRLEMEKPAVRRTHYENDSAPGFDAILSKFHNPFEVQSLFQKCGFEDIRLRWYHYHPAIPFLESTNAALFREEALKMENENSGWRGMFLCSAFVVEANKK